MLILVGGKLHPNSPPTQLEDLQRHGEARLLGAHQGPVAGAEVLAGRQQQQHGHLVSELQQLAGVHAVLVRLPWANRRPRLGSSRHARPFSANRRGEAAAWRHPVEGDVELRQEMRDRRSQGPDELGQAAALHRALVLRGLAAAVCCAVNMTLQPGPLLPVTQERHLPFSQGEKKTRTSHRSSLLRPILCALSDRPYAML